MFNLYIYYHDITIFKGKVTLCFTVFIKIDLDTQPIFL